MAVHNPIWVTNSRSQLRWVADGRSQLRWVTDGRSRLRRVANRATRPISGRERVVLGCKFNIDSFLVFFFFLANRVKEGWLIQTVYVFISSSSGIDRGEPSRAQSVDGIRM